MSSNVFRSLGAVQIAQEREKQVSQIGWTPEHDRHHQNGELLLGALAYVLFSLEQDTDGPLASREVPAVWPFESERWHPSDVTVRNLIKAGAMIAAEIDRRLAE